MSQVFLCLKKKYIMCEEGKCVMTLVYSSTNSACEKGCFYRTNADKKNEETEDKENEMETTEDKRKQ
jgi:hypothetical protein